MFKKNQYIVVLNKSMKNDCFSENYVYKQLEDYHYLRAYKDNDGDTNGTNGVQYTRQKDWRLASLDEATHYDMLGKPYDVNLLGKTINVSNITPGFPREGCCYERNLELQDYLQSTRRQIVASSGDIISSIGYAWDTDKFWFAKTKRSSKKEYKLNQLVRKSATVVEENIDSHNLKPGTIYFVTNNVYDCIFKMSTDIRHKAIYLRTQGSNDKKLTNYGIVTFDEFRKATPEQCKHLEACITAGKYVEFSDINAPANLNTEKQEPVVSNNFFKDTVVHCTTKEQWDFIKNNTTTKHTDSNVWDNVIKNCPDGLCIRPDGINWGTKKWYEENRSEIITFDAWCKHNGLTPNFQSKFQVGKWYKINSCWWGKYQSDTDTQFIISESITAMGRYDSKTCHANKSEQNHDFKLADMAEIQEYLPKSHVDKIDITIPQYVQCIDNRECYEFHPKATEYGATNYAKKGCENLKIYKVKNSCNINNNALSYCLEDFKGLHYLIEIKAVVPSTKDAYDKQNLNIKMTEEELLLEANKRYPIGTKIKCLLTLGKDAIYTITHYNHKINKDSLPKYSCGDIFCGAINNINEGQDCALYYNGQWAEIIDSSTNQTQTMSKLPFKIGDTLVITERPMGWASSAGGESGLHDKKIRITYPHKIVVKGINEDIKGVVAIFDGKYGWHYNPLIFKTISIEDERKQLLQKARLDYLNGTVYKCAKYNNDIYTVKENTDNIYTFCYDNTCIDAGRCKGYFYHDGKWAEIVKPAQSTHMFDAIKPEILRRALIEEAKRKYPIGTIFQCSFLNSRRDCVVDNHNFEFDNDTDMFVRNKSGIPNYVYCKKKWAEILKTSSTQNTALTLLEQAKQRYPIGTKFVPAHQPNDSCLIYCIITDDSTFYEEGGAIYSKLEGGKVYTFDTSGKYGNSGANRVVYKNDTWARIINSDLDSKLEEAKKRFPVGSTVLMTDGITKITINSSDDIRIFSKSIEVKHTISLLYNGDSGEWAKVLEFTLGSMIESYVNTNTSRKETMRTLFKKSITVTEEPVTIFKPIIFRKLKK